MYKAGQRAQWSSHQGTELELVSSRIMVSITIISVIYLIVTLFQILATHVFLHYQYFDYGINIYKYYR